MALDLASIRSSVAAALPSLAESATRVRSGEANASLEFVRSSKIDREELGSGIENWATVLISASTQETPVAGDVVTFSSDGVALEVFDTILTAAGWRSLAFPTYPVRLLRTAKTANFTALSGTEAPAFVSPDPRALIIPASASVEGQFRDVLSSKPRAIIRAGAVSASVLAELVRRDAATYQLWTLTSGGLPTSSANQAGLLDYKADRAILHRADDGTPLILELQLAGGGA